MALTARYETGVIGKITGSNAEVLIPKKGSCNKCGMCLAAGGDKHMKVLASSSFMLHKGDKVEVAISNKVSLLTPFIVYIVPVVFLVLGFVLGHDGYLPVLSEIAEENGIIYGLMALALSLIAVFLYGRLAVASSEPTAKIINVIGKSGEATHKDTENSDE